LDHPPPAMAHLTRRVDTPKTKPIK
jgi:hypothetical protein